MKIVLKPHVLKNENTYSTRENAFAEESCRIVSILSVSNSI